LGLLAACDYLEAVGELILAVYMSDLEFVAPTAHEHKEGHASTKWTCGLCVDEPEEYNKLLQHLV